MGGSSNLVLQDLNFANGLSLSNETNDEIVYDSGGVVDVSGGSGVRIEHDAFASLTMGGGLSGAVVVNNTITGTVALPSATATTLFFNTGVSANGVALSGGLVDPHWTLSTSGAPAKVLCRFQHVLAVEG